MFCLLRFSGISVKGVIILYRNVKMWIQRIYFWK